MKLAISICATRGYTAAMAEQARRIQQCIATASVEPGYLILSGDGCDELQAIRKPYEAILPEGWQIILIKSVEPQPEGDVPHKSTGEKETPEIRTRREREKQRAFRRIADMREAAHAQAARLNVDYLWSLDSDVLPPANALRTSLDALKWDGGYYAIAFCPYPNMLWLGGFGTPRNPIAEDFLRHERKTSARFKIIFEACEKRLAEEQSEKELKRMRRLLERARHYPPDGNVWEVIAKHGWRRRGWMDYAYPGIGLGAMVPGDWGGFGCTLMNRPAYQMADFMGYQGEGTEDLWVWWKRWNPAGLRTALLPHCPCDHVYMHSENGETKRIYLRGYHEPEGEHRGHLRVERKELKSDKSANKEKNGHNK